MFSKSLFVLVILFFADYSTGQRHRKIFRKDYTYIDASQGFYKIHTIPRTWLDAKRLCALDGTNLFYPENENEANAVISFWKATQPFKWVYIGISDLVAKGVFETIDGRLVADVYSNWSPGEPNNAGGEEDCVILRQDGTLNDDRCSHKYSFICKKSLASLEWNNACDFPNLDYTLNRQFGSCYKFHLEPRTWMEAHAVCRAEQSYLAVINSQEEADYLVTLTDEAPKSNVSGNFMCGVVLLGFHNRHDEGWQTVKGLSLEDSGYACWSHNQPDGGDREKCGSMFFNGLLNDVGCEQRGFFICEHEVTPLTSLLDDRFSV